MKRGDVYWITSVDTTNLQQSVRHPYVIIEDRSSGHTVQGTVVVCAVTSNMKRVSLPGNVLLDEGEANLSRSSVVEVSKVTRVNKVQLEAYIGSLSDRRLQQIQAGIDFVQRSFLHNK